MDAVTSINRCVPRSKSGPRWCISRTMSCLFDGIIVRNASLGPSGCGKSTVIQMIGRFYDPWKDSLLSSSNLIRFLFSLQLADGADIGDLNLRWYRSQRESSFIGRNSHSDTLWCMFQFDTTIRENIAYGDTSRKNIPLEHLIVRNGQGM